MSASAPTPCVPTVFSSALSIAGWMGMGLSPGLSGPVLAAGSRGARHKPGTNERLAALFAKSRAAPLYSGEVTPTGLPATVTSMPPL